MTKAELIALVIDRLGGDKQKYHPNVVTKWISMAFNTIYYTTFRKDLGNLDLYSKTYDNVPVLKDSDRDKYYCNFPAPIVQLPDSAEGVRNIHLKKDRSLKFVPVTISSATVFDGLDVRIVDPTIGYVITNGRIEFEDNDVLQYETLSMRIVRPFEDYDDDETVYIPSGTDEQFMELIVNVLMGQVPESKILDDNQKTV